MISRGFRFAVLAIGFCAASAASANHPVLVEGNCDSPVPGSTIVNMGDCGDYDGDGRIGTAEDTDGADRIFGTLSAALGPGTGAAAGTGANLNGTITIVKSGRFAEVINLDPGTYVPPIANPGNVTIKAAPGVEAQIDAVFQGDPSGQTGARMNTAGIIVNMPSNRRVILENLTFRNYTIGIYVGGASRVSIVGCRVTNNIGYGILVQGTALVSIDESQISDNGFRIGSGGSSTPSPGAGVVFQSNSGGVIFRSSITGNAGAGIADQSTGGTDVEDVYFFNNNPNF
jgi:parallel beta-helix repeat protein